MTAATSRGVRGAASAVLLLGFATTAAAATDPAELPSATEVGIELAAQAITHVSGQARHFLALAYDRAPTLVLATGVLLAIPLVALTALAARSVQLARAAQIERRTALARLSDLAPLPEQTRTADRWPTAAALVGVGEAGSIFGRIDLPRSRTLVRIGRQEDNDIQLPHKSVHRYHAVVHRTPEGAFVVMDLSGRDGNGVAVNGIRKNEARLADGARLEFGDVTLRFEARPL
jgi:hypothetical protein